MSRTLPEIEIADLVWQPAGASAPILDLRGSAARVAPGETLLISGASGAGKSTLAAACAGLLGTILPGALSGTLRVGGVDLVAAAASSAPGVPGELLTQLGLIAAAPAPRHALPRLLDDLALPLEARGVAAHLMALRAREVAAAAGLHDEMLERDVSSLSGGERAQAAAASALVAQPGLLIADEPLAGLDGARASALATHLMAQHATRVIVSHDDAPFGAASVHLHLVDGRVVAAPALRQMPHQGRERQPRERGAVVLQLFAASSAARPSVPPLSITLHARELTLVQGETGSGKSTLLGLVAGVLSLDAGERVASSERIVSGERIVSAERIRFAPQDPGLLLGARSVNQLLREGERERAGEVARLLNVAELLDRPAPRCSDGERRRLALVLTAAADPGLLILDEPTLGLDVDAAVRVGDLLDEVAARGAAILVATHDPRLLTRGARLLQCPGELGGVAELSETSLIVRGASLAQEMLSPSPVKRFVGVTNPLTRVGLALFWFLLSALSPATAAAQGAVALPALLVAWSSGVRFAATLRLAATLAPAIIGMVLANLLGGATPEAAIGAGIRLVAFAAGSLVLLRPFEPLRLADAALQHLRAPFAPTLTLLASAATLPSLMSEARERRAIRRLTRAGVDPLLLADLFDATIRAVPRLAVALEVRGVRLPTRAHPATALRPSRFGRADALLIALSAGGLLVSVARILFEALVR